MARRGSGRGSGIDRGDLVTLSYQHKTCPLYRDTEHVKVEAMMHLPLPSYGAEAARMRAREVATVIRKISLELDKEYYGTLYTDDGVVASVEAVEVLTASGGLGWIGAHYLQKAT